LGTRWILLELNGKNMESKTAKEMYLLLDAGSAQFKSHSGCNMVMGEAKRPGQNQLLFTNLLNTTSECKTPDIDAEFQKAIGEVTGYTIIGNILELTKKGNVTVLKYIA
jgi:heat shock protein HslJ